VTLPRAEVGGQAVGGWERPVTGRAA
jgi:hypothetical protein